MKRGLKVSGVFLLLSLFAANDAGAASSVKLLRPEQYKNRVVGHHRGRVLLVNFFATWCEPCREEMPILTAAAKKYPARDLAIVLVSIDARKSAPLVPSFLKANGVSFVTWIAKAPEPRTFFAAVDRDWDGTVPYSVLYARDGKVVAKLSGKKDLTSLVAAIEGAVGAPPPSGP